MRMKVDHSIDPGFDPEQDSLMKSQYHDVLGRPYGEPDAVIEGYEVTTDWDRGGVVPDRIFIYEEPDDEPVGSRMWTFVSVDWGMMLFSYSRHRYLLDADIPDDPSEVLPCCFKIMREHGLSMRHVPDRVLALAEDAADAPIVGPSPSSLPDDPADEPVEPVDP